MNVAKNVCALINVSFVKIIIISMHDFFVDKTQFCQTREKRIVHWSRLLFEQKLIMKISCAFQLYYQRGRESRLFQWQFLEDTKIIELANFDEANSLLTEGELTFQR